MSVHVMSAVIHHSLATGPTFTVALILADHADSRGWCWPSIDKIADESRVSRSTVKRSLNELEALGEVERVSGPGGPGGTNRYRVMARHVDNLSEIGSERTSTLSEIGSLSTEIGSRQAPGDRSNCEPQTVKNRQNLARASDTRVTNPADDPDATPADEVPGEVARIRRRLRSVPPVDMP